MAEHNDESIRIDEAHTDSVETGDALIERLVEVVQMPDSEIEEIGLLVRQLPDLANEILRRANSSEFSLKHQLARVEHAIIFLGLRRTMSTITSWRLQKAHTGKAGPHFSGRNSSSKSA